MENAQQKVTVLMTPQMKRRIEALAKISRYSVSTWCNARLQDALDIIDARAMKEKK